TSSDMKIVANSVDNGEALSKHLNDTNAISRSEKDYGDYYRAPQHLLMVVAEVDLGRRHQQQDGWNQRRLHVHRLTGNGRLGHLYGLNAEVGCAFCQDRQDAEVEGVVRHEEGHRDGQQTGNWCEVRAHGLRN